MTKSPLNLPGSQTEDQFHIAVADLLTMILKTPAFFTTFPAGYGRLGKGTAGKLKARGLRPGMPDILIFDMHKMIAAKVYTHVIGLELKTGRNSTSAKQRECHALLQAVGIRVFVVRSLHDVVAVLDQNGIEHRPITLPPDKLARDVVIPSQQGLFT